METRTRRNFLADVGKGMLVASVGTTLASDLGLSTALADDAPRTAHGGAGTLEFGRLEPLVEIMQENSAERMLPLVVERLAQGTELRDLVSAAALANARTFGGEDYVGFHAFMALAPAYEMSKETPSDRKALPVLKVLYRSTNQIQSKGGRSSEVLHPISPAPLPAANARRDALREAMRRQEMERAEGLFAALAAHSTSEAYNDLQALVQDDADVHRVVLAYRAWDLLGLTGKEYAHTTLRQSVRYCVNVEKGRIAHGYPEPGIRTVLPKVLDHYHLEGRAPGSREAEDAWVAALCHTLLDSSPAQAAETIASSLQEGFSLNAIGEALSLAATQQVLRDPGRTQAFPGKPIGSVHGDSVGVHASDSMNAWRNIARVSDHYNAQTGLIVAGYHLASATGRDWKRLQPYPLSEHRAEITAQDAAGLMRALDGAIRDNHQARAAALVQRYGALGHPARPVFDLLLRHATSEDGALHAEKYYRTVSEEFGRTRKAYRWEHVVALARVTASEYGKRADGYEQACNLLQVKG
jgi:hypothetical protein